MAFDIYSTPAMSDEPERVFSIAGNTMSPRRRCLTSDAMQQLMCLRSWQRSEVITLDKRLIRQAVLPNDESGTGITDTDCNEGIGGSIDGDGGIDIDGDCGSDLYFYNDGELRYYENE
jgi:hypothetical protein